MSKKNVNFDDYSDNYNEILESQLDFLGVEDEYFARYKIELLKQILQEMPANILEYGCGIGRNLGFISEILPGIKITACDISSKSLEIAKEENPEVTLFNNQVTSIAEKFDVIFIANVFHHIPPEQRLEVVSELKEYLGEKGKIVIFEHNPYNPVTRKIVDSCPFDKDAILLKPKEFNRMAKSSSLVVNTKGYCLFFPPFLKVLSFFEKYLRWLPLGGQYFVVLEKE